MPVGSNGMLADLIGVPKNDHGSSIRRAQLRVAGTDSQPSARPALHGECRAARATRPRPSLLPHLRQELGSLEDLAGLGALAGADDAVLLHHVDEARGLRVAQAHAALEKRDRGLALAHDEAHAVPVEVV